MNTKEQYQIAYSLLRKMIRQGYTPIQATIIRPRGVTLAVMSQAMKSFKNA